MSHHSLLNRDTVEVPAHVIFSISRSDYTGTLLSCVLLTILLYDHICTLDKEIKYFWRMRLGITKFVFFINRYIGILGAVAHIVEYRFNLNLNEPRVFMATQPFFIISIDYILMVRTLALYNREPKMKVLLWILLIIDGIIKVMTAIAASVFDKSISIRLTQDHTGCVFLGAKYVPQWIYVVNWMVPLSFGALLMVLALYKATEFWQLNGVHGSRLVRILITDQIIYFLLAMSCSVISLIGNRYGGHNYYLPSILNALGSPTLQCVLGSRLFFNLKEAGEHGVNEGTNWASYTLTGINFTDPPVDVKIYPQMRQDLDESETVLGNEVGVGQSFEFRSISFAEPEP